MCFVLPAGFSFSVVYGNDVEVVKGAITTIERHSLLQHTCFTPDNEDVSSKHTTVTYRFSPMDNAMELSVTHGAFEDEATRAENDANWDKVLGGLKELVEHRAR